LENCLFSKLTADCRPGLQVRALEIV
jgi:hypothetical protein